MEVMKLLLIFSVQQPEGCWEVLHTISNTLQLYLKCTGLDILKHFLRWGSKCENFASPCRRWQLLFYSV